MDNSREQHRQILCTLLFIILIVATVCEYPYNQCGLCDCCAGACENNNICNNAGCIEGYWGDQCLHRCFEDPCATCGRPGGRFCITCVEGFYVPTIRSEANALCTYRCNSRCKTCTGSGENCQMCTDGFANSASTKHCPYTCPFNCETCSRDNVCSGCKPGFYNVANNCRNVCLQNCFRCNDESSCTECISGRHGNMQFSDCSLSCPTNCFNCTAYDSCGVCNAGYHGNTCQLTCSHGCTSKTCNKDTGGCPSCWFAFKGDRCDSCVTGNYGNYCNSSCSLNCKGSTCERNGGLCTEGCVSQNFANNSCESCKVGRHGNSCNQMCPNCKGSTCSKNTGICTDGCIVNFAGPNCTNCITGKFGDTCTTNCPENCFNDTCDKISGNCPSCKPNYAGEKCEECVIGYYGQTCNQMCSTGCLNSVCNRTTGVCLSGCINNYSGDKCCLQHGNCALCSSTNKCSHCINGFYGTPCNDVCSNSCLDGQCEMENGYCTKCPPNMFGYYCEYNCPENCSPSKNASLAKINCNQRSGECIHGCETGTFGFHCNISCSQNCADSVCDKTNGWCTNKCVKGFHGPSCSEETFTVPATTLYGILGVLCLTVVVIIVLIIYNWRLRRNLHQAKQKQQANVVQYSNFPTEATREFNATGTVDDMSYEILDKTPADNVNVYSTISSDN